MHRLIIVTLTWLSCLNLLSPARAATPPSNIDAWNAAFGVTPDQAEYIAPEKRARIW
jgi:predicted metalloendopeptidase